MPLGLQDIYESTIVDCGFFMAAARALRGRRPAGDPVEIRRVSRTIEDEIDGVFVIEDVAQTWLDRLHRPGSAWCAVRVGPLEIHRARAATLRDAEPRDGCHASAGLTGGSSRCRSPQLGSRIQTVTVDGLPSAAPPSTSWRVTRKARGAWTPSLDMSGISTVWLGMPESNVSVVGGRAS
jgi:hypothetical protein